MAGMDGTIAMGAVSMDDGTASAIATGAAKLSGAATECGMNECEIAVRVRGGISRAVIPCGAARACKVVAVECRAGTECEVAVACKAVMECKVAAAPCRAGAAAALSVLAQEAAAVVAVAALEARAVEAAALAAEAAPVVEVVASAAIAKQAPVT